VLWRDLPAALRPDLGEQHRTYRSLLGASVANPPPLSPAQRKRLAELAADDRSAEAALLRAPSLPHATWLQDNEHRHALRHQWEQLFTHRCAAQPRRPHAGLCAPAPGAQGGAPLSGGVCRRHAPAGVSRALQLGGPARTARLAGDQFPLGLDDDGLPVSAQAVGPYLEDRTTIAFAHAFELRAWRLVAPPLHSLEVVA
jgi:amidase